MKRVWVGVALLSVVGMVAIAADEGKMTGKMYMAALSGDQEVPAVKTEAMGTASFAYDKDKDEITYKLDVKNLKDIVGAHIHMGEKGKNGSPVVMIFTKTKEGAFSGTLAEGTIKAADLVGDLKGKKVSDLAKEMTDGKTYINVHSKANPEGEIRGQIMEGKAGMTETKPALK